MQKYPSNSKSSKPEAPKEEPKKIEKVVTGDVVRKKTSLGKRFMDLFVGGDAKNVWEYVAYDVLLPTAKDAISDAVSTGIERMLFGDRVSGSRPGRRPGGSSNGYVSYNKYAPGSASRHEERPTLSRRARSTHDFGEIIIPTRIEAETVIERLDDAIDRYGSATVADLYDLLGVTKEFTDGKYGWTDIRAARVVRVREGYLLDLPRTEPID